MKLALLLLSISLRYALGAKPEGIGKGGGSGGGNTDPVPDAPTNYDGLGIDLEILNYNSSNQAHVTLQAAVNVWNEIITSTPYPDYIWTESDSVQNYCTVTGYEPDAGYKLKLLIVADISTIDGSGGILGRAGPCGVSEHDGVVYSRLGIMQFDRADVDELVDDGQFLDVCLHEIGHIIGLGTLWTDNNLVRKIQSGDPRYNGGGGVYHYKAIGGAERDVPVENTGGSGTRGGHWRETTFDTELMTGYLDSGVYNPMSAMTVAAVWDLGYQVNMDKADAYQIPSGSRRLRGAGRKKLVDDILHFNSLHHFY